MEEGGYTRQDFLKRASLLAFAPFLMGAKRSKKRKRLKRRKKRRLAAKRRAQARQRSMTDELRRREMVREETRGVAPRGAPNILVIFTDDQPPHSTGVQEKTLKRFADGVDLTRTAYTATPVCGDNRASILTGLYAHRHDCTDNTRTWAQYRYRQHYNRDLLKRMVEGGYEVGFFGKFINGFGTNEDPNAWVHPYADMWHVLAGGQNAYPYVPAKMGNVFQPQTRQHTAYFSEAAEAFMVNRAQGSRPWLCSLNLIDPHNPVNPHPVFEHSHDGERYTSPGTEETDLSDKYGGFGGEVVTGDTLQQQWEGIAEELEFIDNWVERLFAMLEETGQLDNTLIIYSADNGWLLGEHGGYTQKSHPWEESARIPFLVRGPGINKEELRGRLVSSLDINATCLGAAGVPDSRLDGRDLRSSAPRERMLFEHPARDWAAVREGNTIYWEGGWYGQHLYNVGGDPYQLENLANRSAYADRVADLSAKLAAMKASGGQTLRAMEGAL